MFSMVMFGSALQLVEQVDRGDLVEIDLAGLQRRHRGLGVRHVDEDNTVDLHHLAARMPLAGSLRGT